MKAKTIFRTLAAAMLMPAMLLTASCSSEDDAVNTGTAAKQGYTLPVTVSVTRQGDNAATRATYDDGTKKLAFSTGDKLFVSGTDTDGAGKFAGTLDYVSDGTFSGTVTTENSYSGDADALFTAGGSSTVATLLPAGYESYGYLKIDNEGYNATLKETALNSFATSKKLAVEQLSFEAGSYTSGTGFALDPTNAILNFTITGLAASTSVTATLSGGSLTISGNVTTDAEGKAIFAMGVFATRDLNELSLTVGGKAITLVSESKPLSAGTIYNISRSALALDITSPALGQIIGSDGKNYAKADKPTDVDAVAVIVYLNGSNGLALALNDAGPMDWEAANTAATKATPKFSNATWRVPTGQDWWNIFGQTGVVDYTAVSFNSPTLPSYIAGAGGSNFDYNQNFWSGTESSDDNARALFVSDPYGVTVFFLTMSKDASDIYVRLCLAF